MKLVRHGSEVDASKPKELKTKGNVEDEASQNGKQHMKSNKSKSMKYHSSDLSKKKPPSPSPAKEVNGTSTTKKSQKNNLDSVGSKEDKSSKKKIEEEQEKSKTKSIKSENGKCKKENTVEVKNLNSGMVSPVQSPSRKRIAENGTNDPDAKSKKPKTTPAKTTIGKPSSLVGGKPSQKTMEGNKSSNFEEGNKKPTENGIELKTYCRRSKLGTSLKHHSSVPREEEAGSSTSNDQTKNAVKRKFTHVPLAKSVKINPSRQHVKKTTSKATRPEPSRISVENSKASTARTLKVRRALGLALPVGSQFIRQGAITS